MTMTSDALNESNAEPHTAAPASTGEQTAIAKPLRSAVPFKAAATVGVAAFVLGAGIGAVAFGGSSSVSTFGSDSSEIANAGQILTTAENFVRGYEGQPATVAPDARCFFNQIDNTGRLDGEMFCGPIMVLGDTEQTSWAAVPWVVRNAPVELDGEPGFSETEMNQPVAEISGAMVLSQMLPAEANLVRPDGAQPLPIGTLKAPRLPDIDAPSGVTTFGELEVKPQSLRLAWDKPSDGRLRLGDYEISVEGVASVPEIAVGSAPQDRIYRSPLGEHLLFVTLSSRLLTTNERDGVEDSETTLNLNVAGQNYPVAGDTGVMVSYQPGESVTLNLLNGNVTESFDLIAGVRITNSPVLYDTVNGFSTNADFATVVRPMTGVGDWIGGDSSTYEMSVDRVTLRPHHLRDGVAIAVPGDGMAGLTVRLEMVNTYGIDGGVQVRWDELTLVLPGGQRIEPNREYGPAGELVNESPHKYFNIRFDVPETMTTGVIEYALAAGIPNGSNDSISFLLDNGPETIGLPFNLAS